MNDLKVALIQTPLKWEDKQGNLDLFSGLINKLELSNDLILLPEMFNTGFSMRPEVLAEPHDGPTTEWMAKMAEATGSVIAGTIMVIEDGKYYNRLIWIYPDGRRGSYDKFHLFRMGNENRHFSGGRRKTTFSVGGWNILPLTCYDLRFPCWSMNSYDEGSYNYDLLLYLANWPAGRSYHWRSLLVARAIENQAFVIGVNRTGVDGNGIDHAGDSMVIDSYGNIINDAGNKPECVIEATLHGKRMAEYRKKFFIAPDWDTITRQG